MTVRACCLLALVALVGCGAEAPGETRDDLDRVVTLDAVPATVLPLAPNVTELIAAAAGVDRLAGVAVSDDHPPGIQGLPRYQSYPLDVEAVVALAPALAVGSDDVTPADQADRLERLGVPTYLFQFGDVGDVPRALRTLDTLLGTTGGAEVARDFERRVEAVRSRVQTERAPRVLLLVGDAPGTLYAFGEGSYASDIVRLAGGDNVTDVYPGLRAEPGEEAVLDLAPEVVVVAGREDYDAADLLDAHPALFPLPAVQNDRVYGLDADLILRPGPRLVEALERLARRLHPQAFAAGAA